MEITTAEQNKEKRKKRIKDSDRDLWENIKCTNIQIIGVPEEEEKKKGSEKKFQKTIHENFSNMWKEIVNQVQEVQRLPYSINPTRNTPRHILIKLKKFKDKEKMLKATREKQQITYKGIPIRLSADVSAQNLQARREWHDILKWLKEEPTTKNTLPSKALIQIKWRNQKVYRQAKSKRIQHNQTSFAQNAKGISLGRKEKSTTRSKKIMNGKAH